jgi:hypothetical protein
MMLPIDGPALQGPVSGPGLLPPPMAPKAEAPK